MMIATSRKMVLPVGEIYTPGRSAFRVRRERGGQPTHARARPMNDRLGMRVVAIESPHGTFSNPFYVIREVTLEEYCAWFEQEHGQVVSREDRRGHLHPCRSRFYEISLD